MKKVLLFITVIFCVNSIMAQTEYQDNIDAAERGDSNAQNAIGICYYKGNGVIQDYRKAVMWYRKAAEQGNEAAQYNLGYCYETATGVEKDIKQAIFWYKKSAKVGFPQAQFNLAYFYLIGEGVSQNKSKGIELLTKAAEQNYANAQFQLAKCYENGDGVKKDLTQSAYWYNLAAQQGDIEAMVCLGSCYYLGEGVTKSIENAISWHRKAADAGDASAQACMGQYYEKGEGVKKDMEMALFWYNKAASQGYELAVKHIENLKEDDNRKNNLNRENNLRSDVDIDIPNCEKIDRDYFAVIIGNENYNHESKAIYAINDAKAFSLYANKTLGIPQEQIKYFEDATFNDLRIALNWLVKAMSISHGQGKALFYYAGHGIPDESSHMSYILPVDGIGNDSGSALALNELYDRIGSIESLKVTLIIDACFSGSKREKGMLNSARGVAIKSKQSTPKGNTIVFTAAQGDETAFTSSTKQHGLFTYYLLKKLQETNGNITYGELIDYVTKQVERESFLRNEMVQTPIVIPSKLFENNWRSIRF